MPNIVASLFGLLGLLCYFLGIIDKHWYFIVPGLYLAVFLIFPKPENYEFVLNREADIHNIRKALDDLLKTLKSKVAKDILIKVENIINSIQIVLPKLLEMDQTNKAAYTIRETALSYLPETLESYLKLPRAYARFHNGKNNQTPKETLIEQLNLLDQEMKNIVEDIHKNDMDSLESHGRFLKSRFISNKITID